MLDGKFTKALMPYRIIGRLYAEISVYPNQWTDFRSLIVDQSTMIVEYSTDKDLCERTLDYLDEIFNCNSAEDLKEWVRPFFEFVKAFDETPGSELEEFCKNASAKLLKEE